jgi:hypothetical protein
MKFHEARANGKKGDKLKATFDSGEYKDAMTITLTIGEEGQFLLTWEQYDSDGWEVIHAEPKVLTAEEWWWNGCSSGEIPIIEENQYPHCRKDENTNAFNHGHQNGRLEMYLKFKTAFIENERAGRLPWPGWTQAMSTLKPW